MIRKSLKDHCHLVAVVLNSKVLDSQETRQTYPLQFGAIQ